jgi:hypothetical protein
MTTRILCRACNYQKAMSVLLALEAAGVPPCDVRFCPGEASAAITGSVLGALLGAACGTLISSGPLNPAGAPMMEGGLATMLLAGGCIGLLIGLLASILPVARRGAPDFHGDHGLILVQASDSDSGRIGALLDDLALPASGNLPSGCGLTEWESAEPGSWPTHSPECPAQRLLEHHRRGLLAPPTGE